MMDDSLSNIPNLGPVRRAALETAGITTRTHLAQASVDQLVGVTGMPRSAAEKILAFLHPADTVGSAPGGAADDEEEALAAAPELGAAAEVLAALPPPDPHSAEALAAETIVETLVPALPPAPQPEDGTEEVDLRAHLEETILRVDTALSDATGGMPTRKVAPKLNRQLTKLAALVDDLPRHVERLKPGQIRRVTKRLRAVADRLSQFAGSAAMGDREQEKIREEVREQRRKIEEMLAPARSKDKARGGKKKQ